MKKTSYISLLSSLYGHKAAANIEVRILELIDHYRKRITQIKDTHSSQINSILITYGDQVQKSGQIHLKTLAEFCEEYISGIIDGIHILPFFPWSSDDGFSIKDYKTVDQALGGWPEVERIGKTFPLMFDCVINHVSSQSTWFKSFKNDSEPYRKYFITIEGSPDLSLVVRPRALPLLTEFQTKAGVKKVWTTFSADQVDLDYHNPDVLLEMLDIILMYIEHGAYFIRLDAIAYLWKEIGTPCIHLPQTHTIIQLLRAVLDDAAPYVKIITETNVPHEDNISYFGNGTDEAQLVYNFALPPLVLHTFLTGNASTLTKWASSLKLPDKYNMFFNFLASHDGIGLNPAKGLLSNDEISHLVHTTISHGGFISFKKNIDGSESPYELNINYFDALSNPFSNETSELQIDRFMASQAILLSLRGIPGIYLHSLFGSRNWAEGVKETKMNRTINRQKLDFHDLEHQLSDPKSVRFAVYEKYRKLLQNRISSSAFHPLADQEVMDMGPQFFVIKRTSRDHSECMLCVHNVTAQTQTFGKNKLDPYQILWEKI